MGLLKAAFIHDAYAITNLFVAIVYRLSMGKTSYIDGLYYLTSGTSIYY